MLYGDKCIGENIERTGVGKNFTEKVTMRKDLKEGREGAMEGSRGRAFTADGMASAKVLR